VRTTGSFGSEIKTFVSYGVVRIRVWLQPYRKKPFSETALAAGSA
jgi:hypothetical protein